MSDPIAALRSQLQQLEERQRRGVLAQPEYEQERARLERALLDHVLTTPTAPRTGAASAPAVAPSVAPLAPTTAAAPAPRPSWRMTAWLSVAVLAIAVAGYSITGMPGLATGPVPTAEQAAGDPHAMSAEQFAAAVEGLAQQLQHEPGNAEGWATLARSYVQLGRVEAALPAFAKAVQLLGDEPRLLADYADAMAVANDRSLEGEPTKLVERALKADPNHLKALALAGTAEFNRKNYAGAVRHWEKLSQVAPPDSPWREQLQRSIDEARELGRLPTGGAPAVTAAAAATAAPAAAAPPPATLASAGPVVSGTVRLAPSVAAQAAPEDTVFLLARPAEGSRMPLAVVRKQVKDLPFEFALDDAMAMSPAMKLSLFPQIVIDARVSKSGQAQPAPGDLVGRTAPIANHASGVVVEIAEVVRN
jgi:cytochrome c-type biogenesis protein CcmH